MKLYCLIATALLLLNACANLKDVRTRQDADGLYRPTDKDIERSMIPELALRDSEGHVITEKAKADAELASLKTPLELLHNSNTFNCSYKRIYRAKAAQYEALADIRLGHAQSALDNLKKAEEECSDLSRISGQEYFRAMALSQLNQDKAAREAAQKFLNEAAAVTPDLYDQGHGPTFKDDRETNIRGIAELKRYRESAQKFLSSRTPLSLSDETGAEVAKFYQNPFFRPGGDRHEVFAILPILMTDSIVGSGYGASAYYSFGKLGFGISATGTTEAGGFYGVKVRESVYESANRDIEAEVFAVGTTRKQIGFTKNGDGNYSNIHVEDSAFEPGVGFGVTKRFLPELGIAGELTGYARQLDHQNPFSSSLYAFYDFRVPFSINAGWIEDRPTVSLSLAYLHVGYNFYLKGVDVFVQGLTF